MVAALPTPPGPPTVPLSTVGVLLVLTFEQEATDGGGRRESATAVGADTVV